MNFMKSILLLLVAVSTLQLASAQADKSKRPSPPAMVADTLSTGAIVSINYSQPSLKGRVIGSTIEPIDGRIWRAGANEATVFETSQPVLVEGKELPAGKYALFMISGETEWTIIFNKIWDQWGAFSYKQSEDALRVNVKPGKTSEPAEKLTYAISAEGVVSLFWGESQISFEVK
jgi:Protein of unknown function (DUF2911)